MLEPIFFEETIHSEWYVNDFLRSSFKSIREEEKMYGWSIQDGNTAHTANYPINVLKVSEDRNDKLQIVACKVSRFKSL
jgi:hypothetical protein